MRLTMQEMCIWSLGQGDPLEKDMETHSSILAWEIYRDTNFFKQKSGSLIVSFFNKGCEGRSAQGGVGWKGMEKKEKGTYS